MALPNIFTAAVAQQIIDRINNLSTTTKPQWGKMNVSQMLAHCNVTYEMVYTKQHPKPGFFMGLVLKKFVKKFVTNEVPYKRSTKTAPAFIIVNEKNFDEEKHRLIDFITRTQLLGEAAFDGKKSLSFGSLTSREWNNMFYKHLDHHLSQFNV